MAESKITNEKRNEMVDLILASIENDNLQWEQGWVGLGKAQVNAITQKKYRGINALYLSLLAKKKGYKDTRWVTFNQAKELGASIKKGEKSATILFFGQYDKQTKKLFNAKTIKDLSEDEQKDYIKENVYNVTTYSQVFNAEQCTNFPELDKPLENNEAELSKQNEIIERIIANSQAPVNYDGGNEAFYNIQSDSIHLPEINSFKTMQDYYATALHEIAHSTGHSSRLNRFDNGERDINSYAIEELRAELASVFMQMDNGITIEGNHFNNHSAYLADWFNVVKNDRKVFIDAVKDAMKISDYVTENYSKSEHTQTNDATKEEVLELSNNQVNASVLQYGTQSVVDNATFNDKLEVEMQKAFLYMSLTAEEMQVIEQIKDTDALYAVRRETIKYLNEDDRTEEHEEDVYYRIQNYGGLSSSGEIGHLATTEIEYDEIERIAHLKSDFIYEKASLIARKLNFVKDDKGNLRYSDKRNLAEDYLVESLKNYKKYGKFTTDDNLNVNIKERNNYLYARKIMCEATRKVINNDLSKVDEKFIYTLSENNFAELLQIEKVLMNENVSMSDVKPYMSDLLDEFSKKLSVVPAEYGFDKNDAARLLIERLEDTEIKNFLKQTYANVSTKESSNDSASVLFDLQDSELLVQIKNADNQFAKISADDGKEYLYKIDREGKIVGSSEPTPGGQEEISVEELRKLGRSKYDFIAHKTQQVLQARYPQSQTFSSENREKVKDEVIKAIIEYQVETDKKSDSFQQQVDAVLNGSIEKSHIVLRPDTPKLLQEVGMKNLPILITAKHIKTITSESGNDDSVNYHGIESEVLKNLPVLIEEPTMILESLTRPQDSIVAVTSMTDSQNRPIICSIMFNGVGQQNNEIIEANIITSLYGKDNFNSFIQKSFESSKLLYFNKEKCREMSVNPGVQFPDVMASLSSDTIIRKASAFVNSNMKNISNNLQKNTLETGSQQKWQSIDIDAKYVCTTYGTSTMIKMPDESVYKHFAAFVPTSLLKKQSDGSYKLIVDSTKENTVKIKNDGLEASLSVEQLKRLYDGGTQQIQYNAVRVRPSKRNLDIIERIKGNTPVEMASAERWAVHRRYKSSEGKYIKQIFNANKIDVAAESYAKCNDSATWCSFDKAIEVAKTSNKNIQGLTYVLGGGVSCIDLDHCFDEKGLPSELAVELVKAFRGTYIERSMSGSGLHIFVKGDLRNNDQFSNRNSGTFGDIEVYDNSKFMSLTGDVYGIKSTVLTTVTEKQQQVVQKYLVDKVALTNRSIEANTISRNSRVNRSQFYERSDSEVMDAIRRSKKGNDFDSLMAGNLTGDRSRDDYRLMSILAYFTNGDRQQTERIYRQSQLFRPNKPQKYYDTTLDKVFENVRLSNYQPYSTTKPKNSGQTNNSK